MPAVYSLQLEKAEDLQKEIDGLQEQSAARQAKLQKLEADMERFQHGGFMCFAPKHTCVRTRTSAHT